MPVGPVRQVILRSCTGCHGIDEYGYYAMDRDAWRRLVEEFGPDATPFARKYVIPKLTTEDLLSDAQAHALLDRACVSCHSPIGKLIAASRTEEQWRETLVGKIARGAQILIDEVDPLIEWIIRADQP
jgi:mono/diheme cytochrome c family protein